MMRAARVVVGVALVLACASGSCALLLDTSQNQCTSDDTCRARGGPFASSSCVGGVCVASNAGDGGADPWACLGQSPPPLTSDAGIAHCDWLLHDFLNPSLPVTSVTARLCPNAADPTCSGVMATLNPDDAGHVVYDLDISTAPFTGYLAVDPILPDGGDDSGSSYMPARIWFSADPIHGDLADDWQLGTWNSLQLFAQIYSLPAPDPKLGIVFLDAFDCQRNNAAGVQFSVDSTSANPATIIFYFQNDQPSVTAAATDSSGIMGFFNLPTGSRKFTAYRAGSTTPIGSVTLYSLPGVVSMANVQPAAAL